MSDVIEVVAAVVMERDRVLLCQRHDGDHLPLLWEFPGGKIEANETPGAALLRELREELGVASQIGRQLAEARHTYPEKHVWLRFFDAKITDTPQPRVHRQIRWVPLRDLSDYAVPPPNAHMVALLRSGRIQHADTARMPIQTLRTGSHGEQDR